MNVDRPESFSPGELLWVRINSIVYEKPPTVCREYPRIVHYDMPGIVPAGTIVLFLEQFRITYGWGMEDSNMIRVFYPRGVGWIYSKYLEPAEGRVSEAR